MSEIQGTGSPFSRIRVPVSRHMSFTPSAGRELLASDGPAHMKSGGPSLSHVYWNPILVWRWADVPTGTPLEAMEWF